MKKRMTLALLILSVLLTACGGSKSSNTHDYIVYQKENTLVLQELSDDKVTVINGNLSGTEYIYDRLELKILQSKDKSVLVYPILSDYSTASFYRYDVDKKSEKLIGDNIVSYDFFSNEDCTKFIYSKNTDSGLALVYNDMQKETMISTNLNRIYHVTSDMSKVLYSNNDSVAYLYDITSNNSRVISEDYNVYGWTNDLSVIYHEEYGDVVANKNGVTERFIYQVDRYSFDSMNKVNFYKDTMNLAGIKLSDVIEDDVYASDLSAKKPNIDNYSDWNQYYYDEMQYEAIAEHNVVRERMANNEEARYIVYKALGVGNDYSDRITTNTLMSVYLFPTEFSKDETILVVGKSYFVDVNRYGKTMMSNIYSSSDFWLAKDIAYQYRDKENIRVESYKNGSSNYIDIPAAYVNESNFAWAIMNKSFYYVEYQDNTWSNGFLVKVTITDDQYQKEVISENVSYFEVIGDEADVLIYKTATTGLWASEAYYKDTLIGGGLSPNDRNRFAFDSDSDQLAFVDESGSLFLYRDGSLEEISTDVEYIASLANGYLIYKTNDGKLWKTDANENKQIAENVYRVFNLK